MSSACSAIPCYIFSVVAHQFVVHIGTDTFQNRLEPPISEYPSWGQFPPFRTLILSLMMQRTFLQSDLRQILGWHPPKEKRIMERAMDDDKWWPDAEGPQRRFRGYPMQLSAGVSQSLAGRNYALYEPAKAIHSRGGIGRRRGRSGSLLIWH